MLVIVALNRVREDDEAEIENYPNCDVAVEMLSLNMVQLAMLLPTAMAMMIYDTTAYKTTMVMPRLVMNSDASDWKARDLCDECDNNDIPHNHDDGNVEDQI